MKALECNDDNKNGFDSYTFVIPENNWSIADIATALHYSYIYFELGQSLEVSRLCNPNFKAQDVSEFSCDFLAGWGYCDIKVVHLVRYGNFNENGTLETMLQCPQCGCGAEGAANLNDLYAAEVAGLRKVKDVATLMLKPHK